MSELQPAEYPDVITLRVELTETLSIGESAEAKVLLWDPSTEDWEVTDIVEEIHDPLSIAFGLEGERLYVTHHRDRSQFEPVGAVGLRRRGKADGAITARSGTTPGTGTMDIYTLVDGVLTDSTKEVTVKNIASAEVTASAYIMAEYDSGDEVWYVYFEDCG